MTTTQLSVLPPGTPVVLANGLFPSSQRALEYLFKARVILCCDGAVNSLESFHLEPEAIIGDLDSLTDADRRRYADRLVLIEEQESNDLTKSVCWAVENGYQQLVILGADGERLDHTIGNASLIAEHSALASIMMVTNQGTLMPLKGSNRITCRAGQQVSIFALSEGMTFTSSGLKYPLNNLSLTSWWQGTLNETLGNEFSLVCSPGQALLYLNDVP